MLNIVWAYMFSSYMCMPTFYVSIHKKFTAAKMNLLFYISHTSHHIPHLIERDFTFYFLCNSLWTINVEILTKLIELCWKIFMSTVIFLRHSLTSGPLQILRSRENDDNCHVPQCNKTWCCSVRAFTIAQTWMYLEWL